MTGKNKDRYHQVIVKYIDDQSTKVTGKVTRIFCPLASSC